MKQYFLNLLRARDTDLPAFRSAANALAALIAKKIASNIPFKPGKIQDPVVLIPILRAGLVFLPHFLELFPKASVGFFDIQRDEVDAHPRLYYENLPEIGPETAVFLLDPMIATGGSANLALDKLAVKGASPAHIQIAAFIASLPGIEAVNKKHPKVKIHAAAVDPSLDDKKFIVPGLGDFGNRYFGT